MAQEFIQIQHSLEVLGGYPLQSCWENLQSLNRCDHPYAKSAITC